MSRKLGVILLNMGGPADLASVKPFLLNLFRDRDIIEFPGGRLFQGLFARMIVRFRLKSVQANYARIGGGSPLGELTERQAKGVEERLLAAGLPARVVVAMRYTPPTADQALDELEREGVDRILALTLYPQYSRATTGSSLNDLKRAMKRRGSTTELEVLDRYPDLDGYLDALAERVREGLVTYPSDERKKVFLLFSAHSLPKKFVDQGDPYVGEVEKTVAGVLSRLPRKNPWKLSYQSQVGPIEWVGPATEEVLPELASEGVKNVLVIPVSFVSDHIETLYEVDMLYGEQAETLGITGYRRVESLNDSPKFLDALAGLVKSVAGG